VIDEINNMSTKYLFRILQQKTLVILLLFIIASFLLLVVAYYYSSSNNTLSTFYLSVGSSLLAATVFSIAHTYYTYRENNEIINSQFDLVKKLLGVIHKNNGTLYDASYKAHKQIWKLESQISNLNSDVRNVLSHIGNIPKEIYLGSNEFRVNFNDNFVKSLSNSSIYYFKGATGRYAISRIIDRDGQLDSLKIILPNPRNPVSFASRQQHNKVLDSYNNANQE